jgi:hypothetical protein
MFRTGPSHTARHDLTAFCNIFLEFFNFLVIYVIDLIYAEMTNLRPTFAAFAVKIRTVFHQRLNPFLEWYLYVSRSLGPAHLRKIKGELIFEPFLFPQASHVPAGNGVGMHPGIPETGF